MYKARRALLINSFPFLSFVLMRILNAILIASLFLGINACNIINPTEPTPTYIHVDSFSFQSRDTLGSSSHKITNVYAYFNNNPVGIFDLPVTFPVIANEPGTLLLLPGIDFEGLSGYEVSYPMYTADTLSIVPQPGKTIVFNPKTVYERGVKIPFLEAFESGVGAVNSFSIYSNGDTSIQAIATPGDVFEGQGSGVIAIPSGKDSTTIASRPMNLDYGVNSYLEIDYKGNMPLAVGMSVVLNSGPVHSEFLIALKPQTEYKKIYIGLRDFVANNQGVNYQVLFQTIKPASVSDGKVFLDNIKVVSF